MPDSVSTNRLARPRTAAELGIMVGLPPPPEKRPTLENWDHPPFNRWSFQNVRSLIPTVEVYRGAGPARALPAAPAPVEDIAFTRQDGSSTTVREHLLDSYTDGFLVLHEGRVVHEAYFNAMTAATQHLSQSVSKSLVGTVCGILAGRGLIDPDAPLVEYVPELARCGYADAHVSHVLDMTSGVRFTEDYGSPDSDMTRVDVAAGWRPRRLGEPDLTIRDVILTLPKLRPHGEVFEYRSIETDVLAWAMERAAGAPLAAIVGNELWQHLGAERDACFTVDAAGTALADGGFNATLRDHARLGLVMATGGRVGNRRVVPADWVARCRRGDAAKFGPPYTELSPTGAYSACWWVRDVARGDIMARGVFGQLVYADPESGLVAAKLSSWPDYLIPAFTSNTLRAIDAIRDALAGA